jgi:hypothetical protein
MTADEVKTEPAGRRMDAWVHQRIFGFTRTRRTDLYANLTDERADYPDAINHCWSWRHPNGSEARPPYYSTDDGAAWSAIEKVVRGGGMCACSAEWHPYRCLWTVSLSWADGGRAKGEAETMPLAACRAVLGPREADER